jgi:uncharacterized OB-fold protein
MTEAPAPTMPAPAPIVSVENKPFWDATAEGRLVLPQCQACKSINWYPKVFCGECGSFGVDWIDAAGTGTVYSFAITRRGMGAYAQAGPYILAYVELDEGPRILTNIVDVDVDTVKIGDKMQVVFHDTGAGTALPRFKPAA